MSPRVERGRQAAALLLVLGLGACSSAPYSEQTDSITLQFGDAVQANKVAQTIDPWPRHVADTSIPTSGRKMQSARERYQTGMILPPVPPTTSGLAAASAAPSAPPAAATAN